MHIFCQDLPRKMEFLKFPDLREEDNTYCAALDSGAESEQT